LAKIFLNSSKASGLLTYRDLLTSGMAASWRPTASSSGAEASGFMKIESSTLPRHWIVARSTPRFTSSAPPTRVSETATVRRAADAIEMFRRRLVIVSLVT
jgi:hypothetical protein